MTKVSLSVSQTHSNANMVNIVHLEHIRSLARHLVERIPPPRNAWSSRTNLAHYNIFEICWIFWNMLDLDLHKNWISSSLSHTQHVHQVSSEWVHNFLRHHAIYPFWPWRITFLVVGSWSGSSPKSNQFVRVIQRTCPQLFEISCAKTNRQTNRQKGVKNIISFTLFVTGSLEFTFAKIAKIMNLRMCQHANIAKTVKGEPENV